MVNHMMAGSQIEKMTQERQEAFESYVPQMNASIGKIFSTGMRIAVSRPRLLYSLSKLYGHQRKAMKRREELGSEGLVVPPVLILSVTKRCNLRCKGCYAHAHTWGTQEELSGEDIDDIIFQAEQLGMSFTILAGGEPLVRKDLLKIVARHPRMIFPLFTNGMLLSDDKLERLRDLPHVVPIVSIEGDRCETDMRRGEGVYASVMEKIDAMNKANMVFGASITVNSHNFEQVATPEFISSLHERGVNAFFFVEYVPMDRGTEHLEISPSQRMRLLSVLDRAKATHPAIYVAFPGDEARFGGCLSSGRGFVHINPNGGLEPCPAAPFTDCNVRDTSLREALMSPLLKTIRDNHELLDESDGGCSLWRNRNTVRSLIDGTTSYQMTG